MVVATAAPLLPFICSCDKKHSTAAQQGIFGNKGKAGPVLLFLKINGNGAAAGQNHPVDQVKHLISFQLKICFFWLVQNQCQRRPGCSAAGPEFDAHRLALAVLTHVFSKAGGGDFGNGQHGIYFFSKFAMITT